MKYARVLLEHCPDETTKLFIDYYTGKYRPKKDVAPAKVEAQPASTVQSLAAFIPLPYVSSSTTVKSKPAEAQVTTEDEDAKSAPSYEIPKPSTAFSSFVDHPDQFITFLEALATSEPSEQDKVEIYTTLFEMYLDRAKRQKDQNARQEWENKAKKLLEDKDVSSKLPTNRIQLSDCWTLDTNINVQRIAPFLPLRLQGGYYSSERASWPSLRYLPLICIRQRHAGRDKGVAEIRTGGAAAVRRCAGVLFLAPANPAGGR